MTDLKAAIAAQAEVIARHERECEQHADLAAQAADRAKSALTVEQAEAALVVCRQEARLASGVWPPTERGNAAHARAAAQVSKAARIVRKLGGNGNAGK